MTLANDDDDEKTRAAFAKLRNGGAPRERRPSYREVAVPHQPWKKGELPKHADGSPASRPIVKGEVRNPTGENGRSLTARELRERCRKMTTENIEKLQSIVDDPDESGKVRLAAMQMIMDRGYGKAIQPVAESSMSVFEDMDDGQLEGYILDGARDFVAAKRVDGVYEIEPGGVSDERSSFAPGEVRKRKGKSNV